MVGGWHCELLTPGIPLLQVVLVELSNGGRNFLAFCEDSSKMLLYLLADPIQEISTMLPHILPLVVPALSFVRVLAIVLLLGDLRLL